MLIPYFKPFKDDKEIHISEEDNHKGQLRDKLKDEFDISSEVK